MWNIRHSFECSGMQAFHTLRAIQNMSHIFNLHHIL
mgnify:CR=1 FL=1